MKWIFITNTTSGQGKTLRELKNIKKIMTLYKQEFEIHQTLYPKHAIEIARKYKEEDDVCLVATGGDGTILEVVNGVNENVPIAILPTGSGNDFSRLIVNQERKFEELIIELLDYKKTYIDICEIKFKDKKMKFVNGSSLGIDADINSDAVKIIKNTKINKKIAYNLAIFKHIFFAKAKKLKIQIDNQIIEDNFSLLTIMNGKYYGNGIMPTPNANAQDGFLDICCVYKMNFLQLIKILPKYKKGLHTNYKKVKIHKCKYIKIEAENKISAQSDGENYQTNFMEIKILEKHQPLIIPKNSLIIT